MKITVNQLRKIIKEEVSKLILEYEQSLVRRGDETYLVDDEGNEEYFDNDPESWGLMRDGDSAPYEGGGGGGYSGRSGGGYGYSSRSRYGRRRY